MQELHSIKESLTATEEDKKDLEARLTAAEAQVQAGLQSIARLEYNMGELKQSLDECNGDKSDAERRWREAERREVEGGKAREELEKNLTRAKDENARLGIELQRTVAEGKEMLDAKHKENEVPNRCYLW